jgi:hypothetical protein
MKKNVFLAYAKGKKFGWGDVFCNNGLHVMFSFSVLFLG